VESAVRKNRPALSQGRQWALAHWAGPDAAHPLHPALVQPCRPGLRRGLYDSASLRRFVGIDLGREPVPDATTLLKFRRLLNAHDLGEALWGFTKVRYRGLQKNATRAFTALALANIYLCRGHLLPQVRP